MMSNDTLSNPYLLAVVLLDSRTYISRPDSTHNFQLYVLSGFFGLCSFILILSMIIRWKKGTFWMMRIVSNPSGSWIVPNGIILYSCLSAIASLVIQGFLKSAREHSIVGSDLRDLMLWRTLSWTPYFFAAWFLTWSTFLSPILARPPNSIVHKFNPTRYPSLINGFFIITPIILISLITVFSVLTNKFANQAWDLTLSTRQTLLDNAASSISQGNLEGLVDPKLILNEFASEDRAIWLESIVWLRRVWFTWVVGDGLVFILYLVGGAYHLRTLNIAVNRLRAQQLIKPKSSFIEKLNSINWAFKSLLFTALLTSIIEGFFFAFGIILCVKTDEILFGKSSVGAIVELGSFWVFSTFGLISTFAILLRSFVSPPATHVSTISLQNPTTFGKSATTSHKSMGDVTISRVSNWEEDIEFGERDGGNGSQYSNSMKGLVRVDREVEVRLDSERRDGDKY